MPRQKKQHLKRRKDGRYCCVYHGIQFMGATEEEALEKRKEYIRKEEQDEFAAENPTVRQYAERWLPVHKPNVREITLKMHQGHICKLNAVVGDMYLSEVKPSHIKQVYSTQYIGLSDSYIKHARSLFLAIFNSAVEDGIIRSNPVKSSSAMPHRGTVGTHRAITDQERKMIETEALDHRMHPVAIVILYAGLRPQEVKALRMEDVDFEAGVIHVRSFVHMNKPNQYIVDEIGKTKNATRDVPLFTPVREALKGRTGYLLSGEGGNIASRMAWAKGWQSYQYAMERSMNGMTSQLYARLKKRHKLPEWKRFQVTMYDLRHTFATWCRDNGVELHTCVEWMGHADAQMILKVYDEVSTNRSKTEAEKLEKALIHMRNNMQA